MTQRAIIFLYFKQTQGNCLCFYFENEKIYKNVFLKQFIRKIYKIPRYIYGPGSL